MRSTNHSAVAECCGHSKALYPWGIRRRREARWCKAGVKLKATKIGFKSCISAVITGNVRSLAKKKKDELEALVKVKTEYKEYSIMCSTETERGLHEQIPDSNVIIPAFHTVRATETPLQAARGKEVDLPCSSSLYFVTGDIFLSKSTFAAQTSSWFPLDSIHIICLGNLPALSSSLF